MGLTAPVAELIAFEATYRPLGGDVAVLGKQTTFVTVRHLDWLFSKYGLQRPTRLTIEIDSMTHNSVSFHGDRQKLELITDCSFLKSLGATNYSAVDISNYEGANIICDMSKPVPDWLHSRFDFIYDGSSLDNF